MLFQPSISTTLDSPADRITGKAAGPATQREAPSPAEGAGGRTPAAGSGTGTAAAGSGTGTAAAGSGASTAGTGPAPARDGDERGATEQGGAGRKGPTRAADANAVVI